MLDKNIHILHTDVIKKTHFGAFALKMTSQIKNCENKKFKITKKLFHKSTSAGPKSIVFPPYR